jgi:hypothetical protein
MATRSPGKLHCVSCVSCVVCRLCRVCVCVVCVVCRVSSVVSEGDALAAKKRREGKANLWRPGSTGN